MPHVSETSSTDPGTTRDEIELARGDVIDDRYRIVRKIGEGTFAKVYMAEHVAMHSLRTAIKILKPSFVQDEELHLQFKAEASVLSILHSRHTVKVLDMGKLDDGRPYISMEYCKGLPLDFLPPLYGPLHDEIVAQIALDILFSLREAHHAGMIHRDIKPGNIMVSQDGLGSHPITHVLDFGIAQLIENQTFGDTTTPKQYLFCTPAYAAPEVLRGQASISSDFYALGLTLAELLEGEPIYKDDGFYAVAAQQSSPDPVPFRERTQQSALHAILRRACEKEPSQRYHDANDMIRDLKAVLHQFNQQGIPHVSFPTPVGCGNPEDCCVFKRPDRWIENKACPSEQCSLAFLAVSSIAPAPIQFSAYNTLEALRQEGAHVHFDDSDFADPSALHATITRPRRGSTQRLSRQSLELEIQRRHDQHPPVQESAQRATTWTTTARHIHISEQESRTVDHAHWESISPSGRPSHHASITQHNALRWRIVLIMAFVITWTGILLGICPR